jgi:hypothetical protein
MSTEYNILKHQVIPILQDTGTQADALRKSGLRLESEIENVRGACQVDIVKGALEVFKSNVMETLYDAVSLGGRVVSGGVAATKEYIMADYHMTAQAHRALRDAIPPPLDPRLEHQR